MFPAFFIPSASFIPASQIFSGPRLGLRLHHHLHGQHDALRLQGAAQKAYRAAVGSTGADVK